MSTGEPKLILLILMAVAVALAYWCGKSGGVRRLTMVVGGIAVLAGVVLFQTRQTFHDRVSFESGDSAIYDSNDAQATSDGLVSVSPMVARWPLVALGALLVICGSLLATRGQSRPLVIQAITVLGLAACGFTVLAFFKMPPLHGGNVERVVDARTARQTREANERYQASQEYLHDAEDRHRKPRLSAEIAAKVAEAQGKAKRALTRKLRTKDEAIHQELPPRAGEIPVTAELTKADAAAPGVTTETPVVPSPPAAEAPSNPAPSADKPAPPAVVESPTATNPPPTTITTPTTTSPAPATITTPTATNPAPATITTPTAVSPPRPDWVNDTTGKLGGGVYWISVPSGLYSTIPECQGALNREIKRQADRYIEDYLGPGAAAEVAITPEYLVKHVKKVEYAEDVQSETLGTMHQIYARLDFDNYVRADFRQFLRQAQVNDRLLYAGAGAALVLGLLSTLYGYLKLDLRTGGAHQSSLRLAATLVALLVAVSVLALRWAVPF